jgi:transketolase
MNAVGKALPELVGGSADLDPSTKTYLKGLGDFQPGAHDGRNIHYGVREHAMAAVTNGIALHGGLLPFCATFFNFLDYCKPAFRLSALNKVRCIYVFTHDSVFLGEDGPTHQWKYAIQSETGRRRWCSRAKNCRSWANAMRPFRAARTSWSNRRIASISS